eukprot:NODE_1381_length_1357_cov_65.738211_g1369_i0.p1 GENE.NODE_1381_length_1357_cov_65.738211_g1369_i0~~NODE_1381_length_1357_cov_65.738211_g1369_i0.p1  ORF type:complete len:405 (+),score=12.50 NODE_1381_length_1357_cov_65.738211_g1369_i0:89-1303(+)
MSVATDPGAASDLLLGPTYLHVVQNPLARVVGVSSLGLKVSKRDTAWCLIVLCVGLVACTAFVFQSSGLERMTPHGKNAVTLVIAICTPWLAGSLVLGLQTLHKPFLGRGRNADICRNLARSLQYLDQPRHAEKRKVAFRLSYAISILYFLHVNGTLVLFTVLLWQGANDGGNSFLDTLEFYVAAEWIANGLPYLINAALLSQAVICVAAEKCRIEECISHWIPERPSASPDEETPLASASFCQEPKDASLDVLMDRLMACARDVRANAKMWRAWATWLVVSGMLGVGSVLYWTIQLGPQDDSSWVLLAGWADFILVLLLAVLPVVIFMFPSYWWTQAIRKLNRCSRSSIPEGSMAWEAVLSYMEREAVCYKFYFVNLTPNYALVTVAISLVLSGVRTFLPLLS